MVVVLTFSAKHTFELSPAISAAAPILSTTSRGSVAMVSPPDVSVRVGVSGSNFVSTTAADP